MHVTFPEDFVNYFNLLLILLPYRDGESYVASCPDTYETVAPLKPLQELTPLPEHKARKRTTLNLPTFTWNCQRQSVLIMNI